MPKIDIAAVPERKGSGYPPPFDAPCAERVRQRLGDAGGLTDFGVNLMRLPPGNWSSQRHWHSHEDEFVYVLEGELTLVEDGGETVLRAGDCAAFAKGAGNGHHVINKSGAMALYLEVGTRSPADMTTCSDIDMMSSNADGRFVHKDGTPYPEQATETPSVVAKTSGKPAKLAQKAPARPPAGEAAKPALLAGGNPQIAKGYGDAPVQAYIAAMPGWKSDLGRRLDALIVRTVPGVQKAVKWNSPLYGVEGEGWFLGIHCFTRYVKVAFFRGTSLRPVPPGKSKQKEVRNLDIREDDPLDEAQFAAWVKQASQLPGERM